MRKNLENTLILGYNDIQLYKKSWDVRSPFYFEPTLTLREPYIADWMSGLSSWKAEGTVADTHLA